MKITLSWLLGFKLCMMLFALGLVGSLLLPSRERPAPAAASIQPSSAPVPVPVTVDTGPMTRAVLDGIYFDVVRAVGQGEQLTVELRVYNTGPDRHVAPGREQGVLQPLQFATVFDEQGNKRNADQVRIANVPSSADYVRPIRLISGVPTPMVLVFPQMQSAAGTLLMQKIRRLELPVRIAMEAEPLGQPGEGKAAVLVFSQIPVIGNR